MSEPGATPAHQPTDDEREAIGRLIVALRQPGETDLGDFLETLGSLGLRLMFEPKRAIYDPDTSNTE